MRIRHPDVRNPQSPILGHAGALRRPCSAGSPVSSVRPESGSYPAAAVIFDSAMIFSWRGLGTSS